MLWYVVWYAGGTLLIAGCGMMMSLAIRIPYTRRLIRRAWRSWHMRSTLSTILDPTESREARRDGGPSE